MAQVRPKPGSGVAGYAPQRTLAQPNRNAGNANRQVAQRKIAQAQAGQQAPGSAPLPWDNIASGQVTGAQKGLAASQEQIHANQLLGEQQFGISGEIGANGYAYNDYKNNPYSQAAILQHNHESNSRGINTTAGQALYSGQTANAQTIDQGRTNQGHAEIEASQRAAEAQWLAEAQAAEAAERREISEAEEGAVQRANEAPNPEVPIGNGGGSSGGNRKPDPRPTEPAGKGKKWELNSSGHWHRVKA
jgi:hypothetical protein